MEEALPVFMRAAIDDVTSISKQSPEEKDERLLLELSETQAWDALKRFISVKQVRIKNLAEEAALSSGNLSEIGLRYVLSSTATGILEDIIQHVENIRSAHRRSE